MSISAVYTENSGFFDFLKTNVFASVYGVNLVKNGDGESGPCEMSDGVTHPTWWSYSGGIIQILYNVPVYGTHSNSTSGPR